jgi:uncharacterized membrane protein
MSWEQALLVVIAVAIIVAMFMTAKDHSHHFYERFNIIVLSLTLVVLTITCWAIIRQVMEMKKVYDPIQHSAETANEQLAVMQQESRAWLGVGSSEFTDISSVTQPLLVTVDYGNFGHQPATDVSSYSDSAFPTITREDTRDNYSKLPL